MVSWLFAYGCCPVDEPLPQSEDQRVLEQVIIKGGPEHCCIHLLLTVTSVPLLKNIPQLDAASTMLQFRDGIGQVVSGVWFPPDVILGIQTKELKLGFIRPENFVSHALRVLQVSFSKLQAMS